MNNISLHNIKQKFRNFLIYGIGEPILRAFEKAISRYSKVGNTAFFEPEKYPDHFDWVSHLESHWQDIRQELDQLLQYREDLPNFQDISPDQGYKTSLDNLWKTYALYGYGIKSTESCDRCPETARIIEQIPGLKTAFFSILMPGKHIPEHRGPYKGVMRCLLGLKVPEPREKCRIRVADQIQSWSEGKCMLFDDSFPHEVWNETDGIRVVLFLDIVRPLQFPLSAINHLVIKLIAASPYIQDAIANQKKWNQRLDEVVNSDRHLEKTSP